MRIVTAQRARPAPQGRAIGLEQHWCIIKTSLVLCRTPSGLAAL